MNALTNGMFLYQANDLCQKHKMNVASCNRGINIHSTRSINTKMGQDVYIQPLVRQDVIYLRTDVYETV